MTTVSTGEAETPGAATTFTWTRARTAVLLTLCLAQLIEAVDVTIVNVSLPAIGHDVGLSQSDLQWVVNAYAVLLAGLLLLGGRAGDLFGHRRVFALGVAVFTAASAVSGAAPNAATLLTGRAAQGAAAALIAPMTLALLTTSFPDGPARRRAFGVWGAVTGVSSSIGVLAGGVLTSGPGWRWIFYLNVPVGLAVLAATARYIPTPEAHEHRRHRLDAVGAATSTCGVGAAVYAFSGAATAGSTSTRTEAVAAAAVILLAWFAVHERRVAQAPLIPAGLLGNRQVAAANIVAALLGAAMLTMFYLVSLYQQQVLHRTSWETGLSYLPLTAVLMIGAFGGPALVPRIGVRWTLAAGTALAAAGMALMAGASPSRGVWSDVILPSIVVGTGLGLTFVPLTMAAVSGIDEAAAGVASALVNVTRTAGGAVGLAVIASVAASRTSSLVASRSAQAALSDGFRLGFALGAAVMALAGLVAIVAFPRTRAAGPAST